MYVRPQLKRVGVVNGERDPRRGGDSAARSQGSARQGASIRSSHEPGRADVRPSAESCRKRTGPRRSLSMEHPMEGLERYSLENLQAVQRGPAAGGRGGSGVLCHPRAVPWNQRVRIALRPVRGPGDTGRPPRNHRYDRPGRSLRHHRQPNHKSDEDG